MNTKHTPAPWKVRFFDEQYPDFGFFVEAKNNNDPKSAYGIEILQDDFGDHNGYPTEQRLADAKLIAASPELLEALSKVKNVLGTLTNNHCSPELMYIVNNAIKKATT